jgi:colanic acid biosynthesis glycosyl transferase WcaI
VRLTLVSLYYWPDEGAVPRLLTELAEDCAAAGARVRVLTSRGRYLRFDDRVLAKKEVRNRVLIERLWATRFGRRTRLGRLCDYSTFLLGAFFRLMRVSAQDIVVCVSSPPMLAVVVAAVARWREQRFVYKVEDLFPDLALALGTIRPGFLANLATRVSAFALTRASRVVAIDRRMAERLRAVAPSVSIEVIPNWADGSRLAPDPLAGEGFRKTIGCQTDFVLLYSGNLGLAHRFHEVLAAAQLLTERGRKTLFLFVGDGPRLKETRHAAAKLENVSFLPFQNPTDVSASHAAADLLLITLDPRAEGMVVPSKFYAALAAGKPILYVAAGGDDIAAAIRESDLGWVTPFDPSAIADSIETAISDPGGNLSRGQRARRLLERRFERRLVTGRWVELLRGLEASEAQRQDAEEASS